MELTGEKGLRSAAQSPAGGGPVASEIPLDLILGPVLLNIFINDLDDDTECVHSNSANSQNLGEADTKDGSAAIQRDLERLFK